MQAREEIKELNDHLQAFPKAEDIFVKEQPWLKNHFLPLMSIDLAEINPEWAGQKVYMGFGCRGKRNFAKVSIRQ